MKERPILFNGEMASAILDDRKTQTRRVMKDTSPVDARWTGRRWQIHMGYPIDHIDIPCPYGGEGDYLWVRETWAAEMFWEDAVRIRYKDGTTCFYEWPEGMEEWHEREWIRHSDFFTKQGVQMESDDYYDFVWVKPETGWPLQWRPSIHMPKFISRIKLEITDVRCEHLQDISEDNAIAEGCAGEECLDCDALILYHLNDIFHYNVSPQEEFIELWDSINKKRGYGWDKNPWVWVIKFQQIET